MITRLLQRIIQDRALKIPIISINGPRQSGKTTLVKNAFPGYKYVNLENLTDRLYATNDPEGFIYSCRGGVILDEVQNVPALFSAIQVEVDNTRLNGQFILTGSQNFLLIQQITQSLAGRVSLFNLLPFSYSEIKATSFDKLDIDSMILQGLYPRIYDQQLNSNDWLNDYIQTYIERDVRSILRVGDLSRFQMFLQMCAARSGQLINLSEMANQLSINFHTVSSWISVLEASFIVFRLQPYFRNINKRVIKAPKLYFYDTGIACTLLGIKSKEQLKTHYAAGALYENFVITEIYKMLAYSGQKPMINFWRDSTGNEVDCIIDTGNTLIPIEIKLSHTIKPEHIKGIKLFNELTNTPAENSSLVYGGNKVQTLYNTKVLPWYELEKILDTNSR